MSSQVDNHWPKFYSAFIHVCMRGSPVLSGWCPIKFLIPTCSLEFILAWVKKGFFNNPDTLHFSIWLLFLLGPFSLYDPVLKSEINWLGINIPITIRRHWNVNIWKIFIIEEVSDPDNYSISWLLILFIIIPFCRHGSKILRTCPSSQSS